MEAGKKRILYFFYFNLTSFFFVSAEKEPHLFDHVVINGDLERAYNDFCTIIGVDRKLIELVDLKLYVKLKKI